MNTVEQYGEDVALAKIIGGELTDFEDDSLKTVKAGLYGSSFKKISLPNVTSFNQQYTNSSPFFSNVLKEIYMPSLITLSNRIFLDVRSLTTLSVENVTNIQYACCSGCIGLTSIYLPKLQSIEKNQENCFYGCTALESFTAPSLSTIIPSKVFYNCTKLYTFDFSKITQLGTDTFGSSGLREVTAPILQTIPQGCFSSCKNLTTVNFPEVTTTGTGILSSCSSLISASLPKLKTISNNTFNGCSALLNVNIPSVTSVQHYAFRDCASLKRIDLHEIGSIVGDTAFARCYALTTVILRRAQYPVALNNTNAFSGCTKVNFYVPDDLVDSYKEATNWSAYANRIKPISELPEEEETT